MKTTQAPTVALVGRTNVGKSSLFNKMLEKPKALVSDVAGTTRDRNEGECLWRGQIITLVDTGGLDVDFADEIETNTVKQAELAIKRADVILFVVDLKTGALPQERRLAATLAKSKKPVIVVGNKGERHSERLSVNEPEWQFPNLPSPIAVSAARGTGVGDLLDVIYETLIAIGKPPVDPVTIDAINVAVIGKPNVGKSTLLNGILGEERFITSPIAHTTREPNDTLITVDDKRYVFIDTAGMRKHGKVKKAGGLEAAAVRRNERIVKLADVTILVVEATEPIGTQEKILAGFLKESGSAVIIVVNKWDLVEDKKTNTMNEYRNYISASFPFLAWAPVLFVSALTKQRVKTVFEWIDRVQTNRSFTVDQKTLNAFLRNAIVAHTPAKGKGSKPPKILGIKQVGTKPPRFDLMIKAKRTDTLATSYIRFLQNRLQEQFKLVGTPIKVHVKLATSVSK
ncbi:ribosome biogenesis GTPase Der [Candidatus Uhrbacteria bacterium CG_4_9_14_3_um_filter_50_9]|uniref:GTPase Der n=1 Tax=Candidatus Uhrbacteria bacterium CG_4_9_14_3_um_filter_50_9 TaxID=1975035 RepID=A0A2M7XBC4_9BACT|nr:MAG: ribosome biogenesis GTPase Der [Candidatus Uhrbacteria bacterium CG_4_9_14_3_um_filter_50_9]